MKKLKDLFIVLLLVCTVTACEKKEKETVKEEVKPVPSSQVSERVPVDLNIEVFSRAKAGNTLNIEFAEEDSTLVFTVRKVNKMVNGVISISAVYKDMNTGLMNLVINEGRAAGKMVIYTEGKEYSIGYDSTSGSHYVQEILPGMRDRLEGSEPLIPGRDN